jgi:hypothetical protein
MSANGPLMSVVVVTDVLDTVGETIEHLRRQTIAHRIELVLVAPGVERLALGEATRSSFHSVVTVEVASMDVLQPARSAGVRAASAPIVFFAESHCFPEPGSFAALVERHREPWAIVGQVMCNGNPRTRTSWANMLMDYGEQIEGTPGGPIAHLPSHNSSYKREALMALGDELEHEMDIGDTINGAVAARGGRFFLEERARTHHLNVSRLGFWVRERWAAGRGYAGRRAEAWSIARRAGYAIGWPLIPLVRLHRIRRFARRAGLDRLFPWVYPSLLLGLGVASMAEGIGYVLGGGNGLQVMAGMELHRRPLLRRDDRTWPDL